jgi:DNA (cytosine-5)-methyltransferase 1
MSPAPFTYYEFFAGGGMARAGLGSGWECLFANDFDPKKAASYAANWGDDHLAVGDVWAIEPQRLPGRADLAWASSPCQDLSLAGLRAGLSGSRSSAFWGFWRLMETLDRGGRAPRAIVIENVSGLLTSRGGADFNALCETLARQGYRFGALEIDAALFTPQSRPRVFVVASRETPSPALTSREPVAPFHGRRVIEAHARLPAAARTAWCWWRLDPPQARNEDLATVLEPDAKAAWHDRGQTERLIGQLAPVHQAKLDAAKASGERRVGALFRRTRMEDGQRMQRAEVRFDGVAGCLRTPGGGSSRQFVVVVEGKRVRTRALSPRECARLMGRLAEQLLEPMLAHLPAMAAE